MRYHHRIRERWCRAKANNGRRNRALHIRLYYTTSLKEWRFDPVLSRQKYMRVNRIIHGILAVIDMFVKLDYYTGYRADPELEPKTSQYFSTSTQPTELKVLVTSLVANVGDEMGCPN